jgi:site-specific recombinase XerD
MSSLSGADPDATWVALERILSDIPTEENRATVRRYLEHRQANGVQSATLGIDANTLRGLCLHLKEKPLQDVAKDDVVKYLNNARSVRKWRNAKKDGTVTVTEKTARLGARTLEQRKSALRPFFKWLHDTDETPAPMKGIKRRRHEEDSIPTDALLTRDDLQALLQAHPDAQAKAKLAVLFESGLRAGEFCSLNVGSVEFDEYGAVLTLPKKRSAEASLKTGARRIRLFDSVPYLHAWYETHPNKDDAKASLFFSMSRRAPKARMTPNALWQFVNRAGTTAGLKKDLHPHLFRHTAATERARLGWNEAQMRAYFGWSRTSDMPSVYVHLAGLDYEEMELERRGKKGHGERRKPALAPITCKVCRAENLATATFCQSCRNPVSPEAEAELQKKREAEIKEAASKIVLGGMRDLIEAEVARALKAKLES